MKDAIKKVFDEINEMTDEEFNHELKKCENDDIAKALYEIMKDKNFKARSSIGKDNRFSPCRAWVQFPVGSPFYTIRSSEKASRMAVNH